MVKCVICNKEFKDYNARFTSHIMNDHNITKSEYYNTYINSNNGCKTCGKPTTFISINKGYRDFCSYSCGTLHDDTKNKLKLSMREKYGVDNASQSEEIKNRKVETLLNNYGVTHQSKSEEVKKKKEETNLKKWGVKHTTQSKIVRKKMSITSKSNNFDLFREVIARKSLEFRAPKENYIDSIDSTFYCGECNNEFINEIPVRAQLITCPHCKKIYNSKFEMQIHNFLLDNGIDNVELNKFFDTPIGKRQLDLYIPEYKIGIEFNGLYFHSEDNKHNRYHKNKIDIFKDIGIDIIMIFENEWVNNRNIVESIIKNRLNMIDTKIFARKTEIKELNNKDYRSFLELNHLQGYSPATYRYGLYYNNELVSVISVSKSRFKNNEMELIRFCNKINTSIIGGFSKLLKKIPKFDNLITYCDRRYFNASSYINNGFEIIGISDPNYFYFKKNSLNLESRQKYQKHKLPGILEDFDINLSESKNMRNNGYLRIFDAGNIKLKYNLTK